MKYKSLLTLSALALAGVGAVSAQTPAPAAPAEAAPAAAAPAPTFTDEQVLEVLGWYIGKSSGLADLDFSKEQIEVIVRGIYVAHAGKDSPYDLAAIGPSVDKFMTDRKNAYLAKQAAKTAEESAKALADAKARPGAVELPSGLIYEVIKPGTGDFPKPTDTVSVNYEGKLANGKVFDSSREGGQPIEFPLAGVIPGWTEGIQKINKGGTIRLTIPAVLGYGDQAQPGIPANSVLIFEVDLLDIKAPAAPAAPAVPAAPAPEVK